MSSLNRPYSERKIVKMLKKKCDEVGGQATFAHMAGISRQHINDVIAGRRDPSDELRRGLGLEERPRSVKKVITPRELRDALQSAANRKTNRREIVVPVQRLFFGSVSLVNLVRGNIPETETIQVKLQRKTAKDGTVGWVLGDGFEVAPIDEDALRAEIRKLLEPSKGEMK